MKFQIKLSPQMFLCGPLRQYNPGFKGCANCFNPFLLQDFTPKQSHPQGVSMNHTPEQILKQVFGYDAFRGHQRGVIQCLLSGRDCIAVMPTGAGKSVCYQVPALLMKGITLVVSPLIALMKDQVDQLEALGQKAVFLNSSLSAAQYRENLNRLKAGEAKLLYMAPETLLKPATLQTLQELSVSLIAVDEAHCISEWGHEFRPEYRELTRIRPLFKEAVWVALTATATQKVRQDMLENLKFQNPGLFISSFNRENLFLEVRPKSHAPSQIAEILKGFSGESGIIYCSTRKNAESLFDFLQNRGVQAALYHAGLSDEQRRQSQEDFIQDRVEVMVATLAFGMGVNKSNIRFVIHADLPKNLESYYQQVGRAGRDGLPSRCVLLYSLKDAFTIRHFIRQMNQEPLKQAAENQLSQIIEFCKTSACRRKPLLSYFGETFKKENCEGCDICVPAQAAGADQDFSEPARLFLRCMQDTGFRFGATHLIYILTGARRKKVLELNHDRLEIYEKGAFLSKDRWKDLCRQMIVKGYIREEGDFQVLKPTPLGLELLKDSGMVFIGAEPEQEIDNHQDSGRQAGFSEASQEDHSELYQRLKQKRLEIARTAGLPPYMICHDKTLKEMAEKKPTLKMSLLQISGMGEHKVKTYGPGFLEVIQGYLKAQESQGQNSEGLPEEPVFSQKKPLIQDEMNPQLKAVLVNTLTAEKVQLWLGEIKTLKLEPDLKAMSLAVMGAKKADASWHEVSFFGILRGLSASFVQERLQEVLNGKPE